MSESIIDKMNKIFDLFYKCPICKLDMTSWAVESNANTYICVPCKLWKHVNYKPSIYISYFFEDSPEIYGEKVFLRLLELKAFW